MHYCQNEPPHEDNKCSPIKGIACLLLEMFVLLFATEDNTL